MKLRTIEIMGFKSFRDHVCVEISDGMTCIVGPNGCGKSNVVDAIKWAMGDMSPKSLRGSSMSDVIFAGTEKLKPAGMAEVTLTFENTEATSQTKEGTQTRLDDMIDDAKADDESFEEGDQASAGSGGEAGSEWDFGSSIPRRFRNVAEIAITRRLHRSGESEYLINKVSCRLRDIRNLLAGTGLGKQGYSIIEQGQIGFIVNARPSERRLIIEEASGITRYKDRRKRAERKLDRTEQNLQRVDDLLDEIEKQMRSLKVQAQKAREHQTLSQELESLEVALLLGRRSKAAEQLARLKRKLTKAKKDTEEKRKRASVVEAQLERARSEAHQAEQRHADVTENYYKVKTRLNLARADRDHAREAREQASKRRQELIEDRERQRERRTHLIEELERSREQLLSVEDQPEETSQVISDLERKIRAIREQRVGAVQRRDEVRRQREERQAAISRIDDRTKWIEGQLEELDGRERSIAEEKQELGDEGTELQRSVTRLSVDLERTVEQLEACERSVGEAEQQFVDTKKQRQLAEKEEEQLARKILQLQTQIESLEALRRRGEGYAEGVRRVLQWAREHQREDIYGPLGDFLQVPQGCESAVAAFFGQRLADVVVRDRQAALDAIAVLAGEGQGRIGCRILPPGVEDPAEMVQPLLDDLEVVEELEEVPTVLASAKDNGRRGWATMQGDVIFSDGRVVGGSTGEQAEEPLRQARQLKILREELAEVTDSHGEADERLQRATDEMRTAEERREKVQQQRQQLRHQSRGLKQELAADQREKSRVDERVERLATQLESLEMSQKGLREEHRALTARRDEAAEAAPSDAEELAGARRRVTELDERLEALNAKLTERKIKVAKVDERQRHLKANIERSKQAIEDADKRIERFEREMEVQQTRSNEARMRAETLVGEVERLEKNHGGLVTEVEEMKALLTETGERVESLELALLGHRQDVDDARDELQSLEMSRREAQLEMEHATEQLRDRFELDLAQARRMAMKSDVPAEERKERAKFLKKRLRSIGEVNALAIEEFEQAKERYEFHRNQREDLQDSVADLRDAIERMDWESRKRFQETFDAVNGEFQRVFPSLFQGGHARLILTEPDDLLSTGVDIEVRPPGKKLQNVNLLSGGEKALTAVSLIFSIFLLKPSPFAILDEVDAPLDDANVGRFAEMVSELSKLSQMLVITHNRRTMEAPQRLYGVTMEQAGVSKVVSVELSEIDDRLAS